MQISILNQQLLVQTERLSDLHRSIMIHSTPVPAAVIENLLLEIRNLYTLALQLNNENAIQLLNEIQLTTAKHMAEFSNPVLQSSQDSVPDRTLSAEIIPKEVKPQPEKKAEEKTIEKKRIVSDIHEMFQDAPTIANRFSDHQTIAEKIAGNENTRRISDQLKTSITDLKSVIGLNEKFQFINHLFNGDAKNYNAAIDHLNATITSETAMKFVQEISDSNNWESYPQSAKSFLEIIDRRFSV